MSSLRDNDRDECKRGNRRSEKGTKASRHEGECIRNGVRAQGNAGEDRLVMACRFASAGTRTPGRPSFAVLGNRRSVVKTPLRKDLIRHGRQEARRQDIEARPEKRR